MFDEEDIIIFFVIMAVGFAVILEASLPQNSFLETTAGSQESSSQNYQAKVEVVSMGQKSESQNYIVTLGSIG